MRLNALVLICLCIFSLSTIFELSPIQPVRAQLYTSLYTPSYYYYPYSGYGSYGKYTVTISVSGLPSEYSANVKIDGNDQGTIAGGSSKQFQVNSTDAHTFQVDNYVSGASGIRYSCSNDSWTLQKSTSTYSSYNSYYYPYYDYYYPYSSYYSPAVSYSFDDSNASSGRTDRITQVEIAGRPELQPRATTSSISGYEAQLQVEYVAYNGTHSGTYSGTYSGTHSHTHSHTHSGTHSGTYSGTHHHNYNGYSYYYPGLYYYPYDYYYPYYYPSSSYINQTQVSHAFSYLPEYKLTVTNAQGQSVSQAGWKSNDSVVTLSTPDRVDKSNVERDVFKSWNVDGTEMSASRITLTMDELHTATANYQTQYYLDVKSDLGSPQGSGWYNQGDQATVSVLPEVPMTGFWGSLGAKYVFDNWSGVTGSPNSPTSKVTMDNPMTVTAMWKPDYSAAYLILAAILIIIMLLIFVAAVAARKIALQPKKEEKSATMDTLNLRYTKGEITRQEYVRTKKDIEKS